MSAPFSTDTPPGRVCLLRLSALGDCANVVPVVHTLQAAYPDIELTWIINRAEAGLVSDLPGVDCLIYDKHGGARARRELARALADRRFDALLNMHASWRANLISRHVRTDRRIGFDRRRARDGQRLFVSERILPVASRHVVDGFLAFAAALGATTPVYDWRVPIAAPDRAAAERLLARAQDPRPILFISPCSSHARRNWPAERYAAVADHVMARHGMRVVLVGGPSTGEREMGQAIQSAADHPLTNLIGASSLKTLLALLDCGTVLLTPDSGPAHMANACEIDTVSLHGATDSRRSGSYRSQALCVDYFDDAARRYRGRSGDALAWGTRIEDDDDVMSVVPVSAVISRLDALLAYRL